MAKVEAWYEQDLKRPVRINYLDGSFFNQDAAGSRIGVKVYSDGQAVTLAGSITGYCVQADGTTVPISGTRSGNTAYIDIPQSALSVPGPLTVTIKNTESSVITTLCAVVGIVTQSRTGVQVDPGQTVTDWTNQISAQLQACQDAADNVGAIVAVPYASLTFPVEVGTYTTNSGNLYCCTTRIETSETFTPGHWRQTKVCNEISDLRSAIAPLGISDAFTIDAFGTPTSYTIHGDFKSGDTFRISCEFTKAGTGAYNCAVKNSANTNIKVFYGNGSDDITLSADTSILTFVLGKAGTITALSADITVLSRTFLQLENGEAQIATNTSDIASLGGQLIENVTIESQLESGYWAFADGQPGSSANYARTIDFVPDDCVSISIPQSYAIYITLLAYNNGSYVGTYNHNTKTFDVISSLTSAYGDFSYDLSAIRKAFPGYRYKLNFRAVTVSGPLDPVDVGEKTHFGMDAIKPRVFSVEKDGSGDFTSLLSALRFAMMFMDAVVYVGDGEWDLVSEYGSGLDAISSSNWGLYLKNRIRVVFSSNSKVTFHYTGSNTNVLKYFSPFNTGKYGFTLENLTLEASRCRYCVHDERGEETDHYECHYINCNMLMDNSQNEAWTTAQCIGGGLGRSAYIDIDGCVFDSNMWGGIVSYHNCAYANSKSNINLHDSYFKRHGTFRLCWYGVSTDITTAYISGCSFASAIVHRAENESATTENTAIVEWNNIIRG